MVDIITPDDLALFNESIPPERAEAMIGDAIAMASQVAPCILSEDFQKGTERMAALKAILRGALLRWDEAGSGAVTMQIAGPYQQNIDTTKERRGMFWPSEINQLQRLCQQSGGAFAVDTRPSGSVQHADICALRFGATYCSCGAILAGDDGPLWEISR